MNKAKEFIKERQLESRIKEFEESSATVELAAKALGCRPECIAKTLSFRGKDGYILIVAAGDAKIDNAKYKAQFGEKAKMLSPQEVLEQVGHPVGGVCPFAINDGGKVYLDISLKRFEFVYAACGTASSTVQLSPDELEECSGSEGWIDVCKNWQQSNG